MPSAVGERLLPPRATWAAKAGRIGVTALVTVGLIAPTLSQAAPASAQTVSFSTAAAAPADSVAYVVMTTDDKSEQWSLMNVLLDRIGVGDAVEQELSQELKDENGKPLPVDAFLGGEVAVVISKPALETLAEQSMGTGDLDSMMEDLGLATPEAPAAEPPAQGFAVILDARAPDTAWAAIEQSASNEGAQETDYEGTTVFYSPSSSSDQEPVAAARIGDLIAISTTVADLEPVIDTVDGRIPAITTLPEFTTVQDSLPDEFLTFAFVDSKAFTSVDLGPAQTAAEELTPEAYSAMTIAADEPGFRFESVAIAPGGGSLGPTAPNFESTLAGLAPANTVLFTSAMDLGKTGVLDAIGSVFIGFMLGMSESGATPAPDANPEDMIAQQYEAAASMLGVNLQTELFQQLAGEYGGWVTVNMESENVSGLFASGVLDTERVSNALSQLALLIQGAGGGESNLTTRDVAGDQVYVLDLQDAAGSTLEFGVVGNNLVIGKGDAVDRFMSGPSDSLADNTQFQAVMDTLPVEHNGMLYVDLAQLVPLLQTASQSSSSSIQITDASDTCGDYETQADAQAAYDAGEAGTFDLDQDFDGQACEDYFGGADEATATATEDPFANIDYSALKAFASVSYDQDGVQRSSSILYISE